jgi:hypothetical protein
MPRSGGSRAAIRAQDARQVGWAVNQPYTSAPRSKIQAVSRRRIALPVYALPGVYAGPGRAPTETLATTPL